MISKDTISLVRDRTDIVAVISESVPSLKKRGRRFLGLCPFHKEKTPSFNVNPDTGLYHCFGCKESGDAIRFLEKVEGYPFAEAVRALAERAGIPIEEERGAAPSEAERHKKERAALYAAMQMAATWYEEQLRDAPAARRSRSRSSRVASLGPTDEAVQAFRIGYAPAGWDGLASFLKKQGVSPAVGESVGLLVPRSSGTGYYDRFRHRLMFAGHRRAGPRRRVQRARAPAAARRGGRRSAAIRRPSTSTRPRARSTSRARPLRPLAGAPRDPAGGERDPRRGKLRRRQPARARRRRTSSRRSARPSRSTRRSSCAGTRRASRSSSTATPPAARRSPPRSTRASERSSTPTSPSLPNGDRSGRIRAHQGRCRADGAGRRRRGPEARDGAGARPPRVPDRHRCSTRPSTPRTPASSRPGSTRCAPSSPARRIRSGARC